MSFGAFPSPNSPTNNNYYGNNNYGSSANPNNNQGIQNPYSTSHSSHNGVNSYGQNRANLALGASDMFASYEEDFREAESEIRLLLGTASGRPGPGQGAGGMYGGNNNTVPVSQKVKALIDCERRLENARNCVTQMQQELRTLPNAGSLSRQLQTYRTIVTGFEREFAALKRTVDHEAVLATSNGRGDADLQRVRLEDTSDKIQRGNEHLKHAQYAAEQSVETGMGVMSNLRDQREVIQNSRNQMDQIQGNLARSRQAILQMSRRVLANKIILMSTAFVLSCTLLLLLIIKVKGH